MRILRQLSSRRGDSLPVLLSSPTMTNHFGSSGSWARDCGVRNFCPASAASTAKGRSRRTSVLATNPSPPAFKAACTMTGCVSALRKRILVFGEVFLIVRAASIPLMPGRQMSKKIKSGCKSPAVRRFAWTHRVCGPGWHRAFPFAIKPHVSSRHSATNPGYGGSFRVTCANGMFALAIIPTAMAERRIQLGRDLPDDAAALAVTS